MPIIYVRVNANIRTPTLDELNCARKQIHIAAFQNQNRDTAADIQRLCEERKDEFYERLSRDFDSGIVSASLLSKLKNGTHSIHSAGKSILFEGVQKLILQQRQAVFNDHAEMPDNAFVDKLEHSHLVSEMISVTKWALSKLLWFIEDDALQLKDMLGYPLQKSYREYVSFCRNRVRKEGNEVLKRERAYILCQLIGLAGTIGTAGNREEIAIVRAVESGASPEDIELMLDVTKVIIMRCLFK